MAITINTIEQLEAIGEQLGFGSQDRLTEGEFIAFVETAQGLLGVDFGTVEENTVTQEGLKAISRLIRTKNLGIETQEGRRIAIMAGLTRRAAKKLLEEHREEQRWMDIGP